MARGDTFPLNAARKPFFVKMWPAYKTVFETPALYNGENVEHMMNLSNLIRLS